MPGEMSCLLVDSDLHNLNVNTGASATWSVLTIFFVIV